MIKAKILMIGANLKGVETELKHRGIRCTELISSCSPLTMVGQCDESFFELCSDIDDMPTHLDIKKNLAQILSKDPANFVQNYNSMPYGKNVDYCNPAEYIIIDNTSLAYELFSNGKYIYTSHSSNVFSQLLESDNTYKKTDLTYENFGWKTLYEQFVDTILKEYDSQHIILIKTCISRYYLDGSEIKTFENKYTELGNIICAADRFFAEKTNCIVVNETYNHIPTKYDSKSVVPFAELDDDCVCDISRIIEDIILKNVFPEKTCDVFLDINDIISLYLEYENAFNKTVFVNKIQSLLKSKNSLPITKAKNFCANNIKFLTNYPYLSEKLKDFKNDTSIFVKLGNHTYIILDENYEKPIYKLELPICDDPDYIRIIEDGYLCSIEEADALCGSLEFYIKRARQGNGQKPIQIIFDSEKKFYSSLKYIDYPDLIENESFLIGLSNDEFKTNNHCVKCDLGFFFDPNVKICILDNGLGDQITHYIFAKRLEDYTGSKIYYDDLVYYLDYIMNDRELDRIIKEDISDRLFSNIFTRKLLLNFKIGDVIPDKLAENGLHEITVIANNNEDRGDAVKKCNKICLCAIQHDYIDKILSCGLYPLYFNYYIRPEWLMTLRPFELSEYLEFPKTTGKNKELEEQMLNCDAVAIQMRRGDFVRLGWESDSAFYAEALEKLSQIEDYPNKKYFVFSDDIPWIKEHSAEMGLDDVDGKVFYIDHNKNEDSLFDMYLISLAKVVIGSASGFVKMGTLLSSRCEDFFCSNAKVKNIFAAIGKKNKHVISLMRETVPNYTNTAAIRNIARKKNTN